MSSARARGDHVPVGGSNGNESKSIFTETDSDTIRTRWREDTLALHRTAETKAAKPEIQVRSFEC